MEELIPAAFYGPLACAGLVLALWTLKRVLLHRLGEWRAGANAQWNKDLAKILSVPVNLLILASGVTVFGDLVSLPAKTERIATVALQGCVVLAIVIFVDGLARMAVEQPALKSAVSQISHGVVKGLLRGFVIGVGALIFLDLVGISITPILASLGVGSLAVALALQDTLSNFFAGIYVTIDKPVDEGDFVKLESGEEGYVIDIGWRSTRIRTLSNNIVVIPNSKLIGSVLTNFYRPDRELAVLVEAGVNYESDLERVEKITVEVACDVLKKTQGAVSCFRPFIRYHTFGGSGVNFTVILRANEFTDQYLIKHEFIKALHARYRKEGIVTPFPIHTIDISQNTKEWFGRLPVEAFAKTGL